MLAFAAAGLGIAIVNGICTPPAGVVLVPLPSLGAVTYRLVRRRDLPMTTAIERLIASVIAECGR